MKKHLERNAKNFANYNRIKIKTINKVIIIKFIFFKPKIIPNNIISNEILIIHTFYKEKKIQINLILINNAELIYTIKKLLN